MNSKGIVFIVDDNHTVLSFISSLLCEEGYTTYTSETGEQALILIEQQKPDLILLDIRLSGIDGFEVCKQIKANVNLKQIPVIFLTAATELNDKIEGLKLGAVDYICKPFQKEELIARVNTHINFYLLTQQFQNQAIEISESKIIQKMNINLKTANAKLGELTKTLELSNKTLRISSSYNRSLIEASIDPLVTIGEDGKITDVNNATEIVTGVNRVELIGTDFSQYFTEPEKARIGYEKVFRNEKVLDYPLELQHRDGSSISVLYNASVYRDENGKIVGVFAAARDITKLKEAEDKLLKLNKQLNELVSTKDKLFSIIAHDLKSPFNSILGFSDLLITNLRKYNFEKSESFLRNINSSAKCTLNLLDNLLNWAKSQTGQIGFNPEKLSLMNIINDILLVLNPSAKIKNISLNNIIIEDIEILADKNMLQTIFRNLISNSIKFTNTNGTINIYTIKKYNFIEISVADNGIGISEEIKEKLFRIESSFTTKGTAEEKGTGLGLILCREFVEMHKGQIWVESELGSGSEFKFTIPINPV